MTFNDLMKAALSCNSRSATHKVGENTVGIRVKEKRASQSARFHYLVNGRRSTRSEVCAILAGL